MCTGDETEAHQDERNDPECADAAEPTCVCGLRDHTHHTFAATDGAMFARREVNLADQRYTTHSGGSVAMQLITVGGVMLLDVHVLHEMISDRYEHILSSETPS